MSAVTTLERTNFLAETRDFLTIWIGEQIFGIPILQVQDGLGEQSVTKIPVPPPAITGSLNLRRRIVTASDVRYLYHPKYSVVTFTQKYSSTFANGSVAFSASGAKTLYLKEDQGQFKIQIEDMTP